MINHFLNLLKSIHVAGTFDFEHYRSIYASYKELSYRDKYELKKGLIEDKLHKLWQVLSQDYQNKLHNILYGFITNSSFDVCYTLADCEITYAEPLVDINSTSLGKWNYIKNEIYLSKTMYLNPAFQNQIFSTLYHEAIHALVSRIRSVNQNETKLARASDFYISDKREAPKELSHDNFSDRLQLKDGYFSLEKTMWERVVDFETTAMGRCFKFEPEIKFLPIVNIARTGIEMDARGTYLRSAMEEKAGLTEIHSTLSEIITMYKWWVHKQYNLTLPQKAIEGSDVEVYSNKTYEYTVKIWTECLKKQMLLLAGNQGKTANKIVEYLRILNSDGVINGCKELL